MRVDLALGMAGMTNESSEGLHATEEVHCKGDPHQRSACEARPTLVQDQDAQGGTTVPADDETIRRTDVRRGHQEVAEGSVEGLRFRVRGFRSQCARALAPLNSKTCIFSSNRLL